MVMIDGIPYIYFIRSMASLDEFSRFVERIIKLFDDRLILGISDELPPRGDMSVIRLVAEIIDRTKVLS